MIRLIATDMDSTLLNENSELSPRTVRAVQRVNGGGGALRHRQRAHV